MRLYDLPLWAMDTEAFPPEGVGGVGWIISTRTVPYCSYGSRAWERHFFSMREKYPRYSVGSISEFGAHSKPRIAPQVIVKAKSRLVAQKAFELLTTAMSVIDGNISFDFSDGLVVPADRRNLEDLSVELVSDASHNVFSRSGTLISARLAAAVSRYRYLSYSAFKLKLSYEIASAHWVNFSPTYNPKAFGVTQSLSGHVRMATAITLAYSAIEELRLEPRPIANKPVKQRGVWDPAALSDLQARLRGAKIDLGQSQIWNMRGSVTRIHRSDRFPTGAKASWAQKSVRDRHVRIEDAIVAASWLRSKCSTHKYLAQTSSLSMYDVANVQNLARRLLLEKCKIWGHLILANSAQVRAG